MLIWLIVVIVVIAAVIVKIKRSSRFIVMRIGEQEPPATRKAPGGEVEHMSGCALCGLYIPDSEAIQWQGKTFCCREHAQQYTQT